MIQLGETEAGEVFFEFFRVGSACDSADDGVEFEEPLVGLAW